MNRYDRQEGVHQIGSIGQQKINHATIMIVDVGALGSYTAEQLVRAGVKRLILIDPDTVDVTNLRRQSFFTEEDASQQRLKVEAAKEHSHKINSVCQITAIPAPITADLIGEYQFTLCLDRFDNYQARDLLNRLVIIKNFGYLFASCAGTYGNITMISPQNHPCLNCLFPNINELKQNGCDLIGINTALISIVAGLQVSLALRYLVDKTQVNFNELIAVDNWSMQFSKFAINKNYHCPTCVEPSSISLEEELAPELHMLCGGNAYYTIKEKPINFGRPKEFLAKKELLTNANRLSLHFKWENRPVSIFPKFQG